ncbi:MAG: hypothetical protein HRT51_03580 [Colwellia sp.]|nr:hypothetical protein [Colwellia sp.]
MKIKMFICFMLLAVNTAIYAAPKVLVKHHRNAKNLAEIQITNQTIEKLICYVAIDGHKIYFRLPARLPSKWYTATDVRFNHASFSTWCDYLSLHPKYQQEVNYH